MQTLLTLFLVVFSPARPVDAVRVTVEVLDAQTREPIERVMIEGGQRNLQNEEDVAWGFSRGEMSSATGTYVTTIDWDRGFTARVVADGYEPMAILDANPVPGVKNVKRTLLLEPGPLVSGRVLDHADKPVHGALVYTITETGLELSEWTEDEPPSDRTHVVTDADGRFQIRLGAPRRLVVSCPEMRVWPVTVPKDQHGESIVRLPKRAMISLSVDIPGADEEHEVYWQLTVFHGEFSRLNVYGSLHVQNGSRAVVSGLPPGTYHVSRTRMARTGQLGFSRRLDPQELTLQPGTVESVRFFRKDGVAIEGQVQGLLEAKLGEVLISVKRDGDPTLLDFRATDGEGRFRTDRLLPGTYAIEASGYLISEERLAFSGFILPTHISNTKVTIPDSGACPPVVFSIRGN